MRVIYGRVCCSVNVIKVKIMVVNSIKPFSLREPIVRQLLSQRNKRVFFFNLFKFEEMRMDVHRYHAVQHKLIEYFCYRKETQKEIDKISVVSPDNEGERLTKLSSATTYACEKIVNNQWTFHVQC